MIHWPYNGVGPIKVPMHVLWRKMEDLVKKGFVRSIGISNFNIQLVADMLTYAEIKPAVNQIQIYPEMAQVNLVRWLLEQNI
jgi:D-xylose reductase